MYMIDSLIFLRLAAQMPLLVRTSLQELEESFFSTNRQWFPFQNLMDILQMFVSSVATIVVGRYHHLVSGSCIHFVCQSEVGFGWTRHNTNIGCRQSHYGGIGYWRKFLPDNLHSSMLDYLWFSQSFALSINSLFPPSCFSPLPRAIWPVPCLVCWSNYITLDCSAYWESLSWCVTCTAVLYLSMDCPRLYPGQVLQTIAQSQEQLPTIEASSASETSSYKAKIR